jgi:hypothetical protein
MESIVEDSDCNCSYNLNIRVGQISMTCELLWYEVPIKMASSSFLMPDLSLSSGSIVFAAGTLWVAEVHPRRMESMLFPSRKSWCY